jgi:hypothetical protein
VTAFAVRGRYINHFLHYITSVETEAVDDIQTLPMRRQPNKKDLMDFEGTSYTANLSLYSCKFEVNGRDDVISCGKFGFDQLAGFQLADP